jgi:hypothetical protein
MPIPGPHSLVVDCQAASIVLPAKQGSRELFRRENSSLLIKQSSITASPIHRWPRGFSSEGCDRVLKSPPRHSPLGTPFITCVSRESESAISGPVVIPALELESRSHLCGSAARAVVSPRVSHHTQHRSCASIQGCASGKPLPRFGLTPLHSHWSIGNHDAGACQHHDFVKIPDSTLSSSEVGERCTQNDKTARKKSC